MAWRASTLHDLIMVAFVRHGPHTNRELQERINRSYFDEWLLLYGPYWRDHYYGERERKDGTKVRGMIRGNAPVGYTDLYPRIKKLEKRGLLIHTGDRSGAYIWRAVTRAELTDRAAERRGRLRVPAELREQAADAAGKIGCGVSFEVEGERGYIRMQTPRGPVRVDGPPEQSWWDAAIDLGLA